MNAERSEVVTARARKRLAFTWWPAAGVLANIAGMWPPTAAVTAGAIDLKGTCTMSMPAREAKLSATR